MWKMTDEFDGCHCDCHLSIHPMQWFAKIAPSDICIWPVVVIWFVFLNDG